MNLETKYCKYCDTHKPKDEFPKRSGRCTDCNNAHRRADRKANPEKYKKHNRTYYLKHKEAINKYNSAAQKANPERTREYCRKHYHKDIEKTRVRKAANARKHSDQRRTYKVKHVAANRDHYNAQAHLRRVKLYSLDGFWTPKDIAAMLVRQDCKCTYCGRNIALSYTVDHVIPVTREGSSNWPTNLQLLCMNCNCSKKDKTHEEYLEYLAKKAQVAA